MGNLPSLGMQFIYIVTELYDFLHGLIGVGGLLQHSGKKMLSQDGKGLLVISVWQWNIEDA